MTEPAFRYIDTNGVRLRVVVEGSGPLVVLLHGFPQGWQLWRDQIAPLAAAGYQVAVPDQRGYGGSDRPSATEAYDLVELTNDVIGLADALGHRRFVVVGHDFGSPVASHLALLHPDRIRGVVLVGVPYSRWPADVMTSQATYGEAFSHFVYLQQPDTPEAELEADVRRSMRFFLYAGSVDAPLAAMAAKRVGEGWMDGIDVPAQLPSAFTEDDLDYYTQQFANSGFRGPINWYRNIDRSMKMTEQLETAKIEPPLYFISGEQDPVLQYQDGTLIEQMRERSSDLRGITLIPGAGHWVPREQPARMNEALIAAMSDLHLVSEE